VQNYNFFWIYAKKLVILHRFSQKGEDIDVFKALLTNKTLIYYEENASYRSCCFCCNELRQQVLREKVLPGYLQR
jgi:hypothetical protein